MQIREYAADTLARGEGRQFMAGVAYREEGRLYMHHDLVAFAKAVTYVRQRELDRAWLVWHKWLLQHTRVPRSGHIYHTAVRRAGLLQTAPNTTSQCNAHDNMRVYTGESTVAPGARTSFDTSL